MNDKLSNGVTLIAEERARQITEEGFDAERDDKHTIGELAAAAACYAQFACAEALHGRTPVGYPGGWPWDGSWWKPKGQIRDLVRAGALIAAEIDRLQRLKEKKDGS
jgi:hypothetical protein